MGGGVGGGGGEGSGFFSFYIDHLGMFSGSLSKLTFFSLSKFSVFWGSRVGEGVL